jgi:group I intron endonuclease
VKTYIYIIENKLNGDCYVGKTNDVERRWKKHRSNVRSGSTHLSRAMRKHGIENFEIRVVDEHDDEMYALQTLEPMWIQHLRESGVGLYNMTEGGEGISGLKHSSETISKMSQSQMGRIVSEESKEKIREKLKGVRPSEASIAKIKENLTGRKKPARSEAHRKNLGESLRGRVQSDTEKEIRRQSALKSDKVGHPIDEATRKKIAESLRGQVQSEETRARRAESMRRAWALRKASSQDRPS